MTRVLIRADSGHHIGSGHVMRMLSVADQLVSRGARVTFACRCFPGHLCELISAQYPLLNVTAEQDQGFTPSTVNDDSANVRGSTVNDSLNQPLNQPLNQKRATWSHSHWLPDTEAQDAIRLCALVAEQSLSFDWCLVDHFALSAQWQRHVAESLQCRIAVIDGLLDRPHHCDYLINPVSLDGIGCALPWPSLSRVGRYLAGPKYIPLRREFDRPVRVRTALKRVLIACGGVDASNLTVALCRALASSGWLQRVDVLDVVIGANYPFLTQLRSWCDNYTGSGIVTINVHQQVQNMAELMASADVALGAGGTMNWERCAMALPTIAWSVADNQTRSLEALAGCGALVYAGYFEVDDHNSPAKCSQLLVQSLNNLAMSPQRLTDMSQQALAVMQDWQLAHDWLDVIASNTGQ